MLQHSIVCASRCFGYPMDTASSTSNQNRRPTIVQGNGLAQEQIDAACLVHKTNASPEFKRLNGSPTTGNDLAKQHHNGPFESLCGNDPQNGSKPDGPSCAKDGNSRSAFCSSNLGVRSSCSLDDAGQPDRDSLTNNLLSNQQEVAATCSNSITTYAASGTEGTIAQQQTTDEHAKAADGVDCSSDAAAADARADADSDKAQHSLPNHPCDYERDACCVFFARVPPTVPYESILALFQQFGTVKLLNLFRPWASAKTSKGCGIVEYGEAPAALAAMEALHTKYHWTGGDTTMVVEWMDPARHRKEKQAQQEDGKASRSSGEASKASKASKAARRRNIAKSTGRPFVNFSSMSSSLPNMSLGGHLMPMVAGLAGNMCGSTYGAQQYSAPSVMGMAAGDLALHQAAALAGMTSSLVDPAAAVGIGMSPLHTHGFEQGAGLPPAMYGATRSFRSHDGSISSWAMPNMPEPVPAITHTASQASADRAALANLLMQQHREAAINSVPNPGAVQRFALNSQGSIGVHGTAHTASQQDLQHLLEHLNNQQYSVGLANVDAGLGSMIGAPPLHGLNAGSGTAGGYTTLQAGIRTGSPAASGSKLLLNSSCPYNTPSMATAAAAAAHMMAAGSTTSSVAGGYGCGSAALPRIATRSSDGGVFSMCGQDFSPLTATSDTPTYFQQAYSGTVAPSNPSWLGLDAAGTVPALYGSTHFMGPGSGAASTAAALQDQLAGVAAAGMMVAAQRAASHSRMATAVRRNSSGLAPFLTPMGLPSHGSMGDLLTGQSQWGSM